MIPYLVAYANKLFRESKTSRTDSLTTKQLYRHTVSCESISYVFFVNNSSIKCKYQITPICSKNRGCDLMVKSKVTREAIFSHSYLRTNFKISQNHCGLNCSLSWTYQIKSSELIFIFLRN